MRDQEEQIRRVSESQSSTTATHVHLSPQDMWNFDREQGWMVIKLNKMVKRMVHMVWMTVRMVVKQDVTTG